jgi:hypothetical protein
MHVVALFEESLASVGLPQMVILRREHCMRAACLCFERTLALSAHPDGIDQPISWGAFNARLARFLCMNVMFHTSNVATLRLECKRCQSGFQTTVSPFRQHQQRNSHPPPATGRSVRSCHIWACATIPFQGRAIPSSKCLDCAAAAAAIPPCALDANLYA